MAVHSPVVEEGVGRPPKDTVQITLRIPTPWLARADAIAEKLAPPGADFGRPDAFRAAIAKGFEALEAELSITKKKTAKK